MKSRRTLATRTSLAFAAAFALCSPGCGTSATADAGGDAAASLDASTRPPLDASPLDDSGIDATTPDAPDAQDASSPFLFTSGAFVDQGTLPAEFTCDGAGDSPPLAWSGVPARTAELALLMTTVAPDGLKWNWVLYHIPTTATELPARSDGVGTAGLTSDGPKLAYSPPCSQGPGAKTYVFTLYALSGIPAFSLPPNQISGKVVTDTILPLTLASRKLTVSYTRR